MEGFSYSEVILAYVFFSSDPKSFQFWIWKKFSFVKIAVIVHWVFFFFHRLTFLVSDVAWVFKQSQSCFQCLLAWQYPSYKGIPQTWPSIPNVLWVSQQHHHLPHAGANARSLHLSDIYWTMWVCGEVNQKLISHRLHL
jgi:hypothetical protein